MSCRYWVIILAETDAITNMLGCIFIFKMGQWRDTINLITQQFYEVTPQYLSIIQAFCNHYSSIILAKHHSGTINLSLIHMKFGENMKIDPFYMARSVTGVTIYVCVTHKLAPQRHTTNIPLLSPAWLAACCSQNDKKHSSSCFQLLPPPISPSNRVNLEKWKHLFNNCIAWAKLLQKLL